MRPIGSAFALAIAAVLVLSCGLPGASQQPGTEDQPGPGSALIQGSPPISGSPIKIEFIDPDGTVVEAQTARIPAGNDIRATFLSLPGSIGVRVNGMRCEGQVPLESDRLTLVTVHIEYDRCVAETVGARPLT